MKWNEEKIVAVKCNLCNCVKKPEKNSGLQRGLNLWPHHNGAMLYQLSYEATDVGSRSMRNEMKWRKDRRSEMQFMQLCKEAWKKFRTSMGFEPMTSQYRCDALPTELCNCVKKPERKTFFQAFLRNYINL